MSYLEDIQPYYERIKLQQSGGGGIRNREMMLEIANIHFKYIHSKDFKTITDIGCRVCVTRMMNQLVGLYNTEIKKQGDKMTFPKQERPDIVVKSEDILMSGDSNKKSDGLLEVIKPLTLEDLAENIKEIYTIESDTTVQVTEVIPKKWGAFKKYCTSKGLKVQGKTKKELLKELGL